MDLTNFIQTYASPKNIESGNKAVIITEPKTEEGKYGPQLECTIEVNKEKMITKINKSSARKCSEEWTKQSNAWIGKTLIAEVAKMQVKDEMIDVLFWKPHTDIVAAVA